MENTAIPMGKPGEDRWNPLTVRTHLRDPISLKVGKYCACGEYHIQTTPHGVISTSGHILFHCSCGSTLLVIEDYLQG